MSLSLLASAHALPASQSAALSPAGSALVRGLWTADETKVNLRNATSFLLQSKQAAAGQCWMWSDPHVETLGGDSADFMPHEDPIHTLVAKPGAYNIQSYHCPVVQSTCQPDYYPCGASAAVAYAGTFTDKSGKPKSIVMWGQRVVVCGAADNCREIDLGVKGDWNPTTKTIGDGCVLERKYNRANGGGGDAVKSPGDYETSFTCGGAKLVTWYYDEVHMPTGYLMNALVTVPDADKGAVTGLCHATTGADAAATTCAEGDFYGRWATAGPVDILKKLGKACGSAVPDCNPKEPKPSPPPSPKPSPPPSPKPSPPPSPPPKLEWGYITDVEEDPEIVALFDKAVKGQTITFPKGSESDYCVKKDPDCKHKNLPENKGIKGPPWKAYCDETCTPCTSCKITEHHDSCAATGTWSDAEVAGSKLKETADGLPSGPVQVGFTAEVDKSKITGADHGCCSSLSCVGWYFQTSEIEVPKGTKFRYQFKASKEKDWFEIVAALYRHDGEVDRDEDGVAKPKQGKLVKRKVLRGKSMVEYLTQGFEVPKDGKYYLAFFAASYDFTAGAQLGADLTVKSFEYELPGGQVHRELDVKIPGAQAALDQAEKKFEGEFEDAAKVADQPGEKAADGRLKDAIGTFEKVAKDAFEKNKESKKKDKKHAVRHKVVRRYL
jgi:hypothetical protein